MASSATNADVNDFLNFTSQLMGEQATAWGTNVAASSALMGAWQPVLSSGQIPYGYSPTLDAAMRTNIVNQGTEATANAINAQQLRSMQQGGGVGLPSGANAQVAATTEAAGQQKTAEALTQEREAGFNQGVTNLTSATAGIEKAAGLESPTGTAEAANQAGGQLLAGATEQYNQNQNSLWKQVVGGIAGGVGSMITGGLGNLDTTGGSTGGEQFMNFLTGMGGSS